MLGSTRPPANTMALWLIPPPNGSNSQSYQNPSSRLTEKRRRLNDCPQETCGRNAQRHRYAAEICSAVLTPPQGFCCSPVTRLTTLLNVTRHILISVSITVR